MKYKPVKWFQTRFTFFALACGILPGLINHLAILLFDYEVTWRNFLNMRPGLAYDIGHGAVFVFVFHFFRLAGRAGSSLMLLLTAGFLVYNYGDYSYYTNFQTHIPWYVFGYSEQAGSFTSSLYYFISRDAFYYMVLLPLAGLVIWFIVVSRRHQGWMRHSRRQLVTSLLLALGLFIAGNSYGNSYGSKNDENPLMYNVFRFLRVTSRHGQKVKRVEKVPGSVIKKWPQMGTFYWHYALGDSEYPFLRRQPRVLCNGGDGVSVPKEGVNDVEQKNLTLNLTNNRQNELNAHFCPLQKGTTLNDDETGDQNADTSAADATPADAAAETAGTAGSTGPPGKKKVNILLVLLENFRAHDTGAFGNSDLTPGFDHLTANSVVFPNAFANGARTKDAMIGIYCSVMPVPFLHIMRFYRDRNYRCLPAVMNDAGYHTAWLHNGDANFDFRHYFFKRNGFDDIIDKFSMSGKAEQAGWGPVDSALYERAFEYFKKVKRPYFASMLSLTNHHPYEAPKKWRRYTGKDDYERYKDTQRYTDHAFAEFMKKMATLPDWENTVVIVTGDHGNHLGTGLELRNRDPDLYHRMRSRVPLIIYTPALKKQVVQQQTTTLLDLAPTILDIAGIDEPRSHWMGLSAFIQDEERFHITRIDHVYTALHQRGRTRIDFGLEEKPKWLRRVLRLNNFSQYLLEKNKIWPVNLPEND